MWLRSVAFILSAEHTRLAWHRMPLPSLFSRRDASLSFSERLCLVANGVHFLYCDGQRFTFIAALAAGTPLYQTDMRTETAARALRHPVCVER